MEKSEIKHLEYIVRNNGNCNRRGIDACSNCPIADHWQEMCRVTDAYIDASELLNKRKIEIWKKMQ